jgi:predicted ATP-dependent Lon-type protease
LSIRQSISQNPNQPLKLKFPYPAIQHNIRHLQAVLYRQELQVTSGPGRLSISGVGSSSKTREAVKVGFDYFKANASRVSASAKNG